MIDQNNDDGRSRSARWMSAGFFVLFFGWSGAQQYLTIWFDSLGMGSVGNRVLLLVYAFFALGNPIAYRVLRVTGVRRAMSVASLVYGLTIFAVWHTEPSFVYSSAIACGIAAAVLWTGQPIAINTINDTASRAATAAFFWRVSPLGSALGILAVSMMAGHLGLASAIIACAVVALASSLVFLQMHDDCRPLAPSPTVRDFPSLHSMTLGCVTPLLAIRIVNGLFIAQVPRDVVSSLGQTPGGMLMASYFLVQIIVAGYCGRVVASGHYAIPVGIASAMAVAGLILLAMASEPAALVFGVALVAIATTLLNVVISVVPNSIARTTGEDLYRVSSTFALVNSCGYLIPFIAMGLLPRGATYGLAIFSVAMTCLIFQIAASRLAASATSEGRDTPTRH